MIFKMLCALIRTITITLGINLDHLYTIYQIDGKALALSSMPWSQYNIYIMYHQNIMRSKPRCYKELRICVPLVVSIGSLGQDHVEAMQEGTMKQQYKQIRSKTPLSFHYLKKSQGEECPWKTWFKFFLNYYIFYKSIFLLGQFVKFYVIDSTIRNMR